MPSFDTLGRWERYVPTLANNAELERPFYLRVCAGLTLDEYRTVIERISRKGSSAADIAQALDGVVVMGDEPLTVRGREVATLAEYLDLAAHQRGQDLLMELLTTISRLNSVEGVRELFSARLSGGSRTTRPYAPGTADTQNGSSTNPSHGPTPPPAPPASDGAEHGSTSTAPSDPPTADASTSTAS